MDNTQIETEYISDMPLLLAHIKKMGIPELLDQHIPRHPNSKGANIGIVVWIWLAHILSEADHRMEHVEEYVESVTVQGGKFYKSVYS